MSRDFFDYLSKQENESYWYAPGSNQKVYKNGDFCSKAKKAHAHTLSAIDYDTNRMEYSAKREWGEVYGSTFAN
jgi:hypothetical protein